MIIEPGLDVPAVANMIELARTNSYRLVDVTILDSEGKPVDIVEETTPSGSKGALDLEVTDSNGTSILTDTYWPEPTPPTISRIRHDATGKYSIKMLPDETTTSGTTLFNWHARVNENTENLYRTQVMQVVSPKVLSILPMFRLMIDKSIKPNVPEKYCYIGYSDSMLILYLMQGLSYINGRPPYPVWNTLDDFPVSQFSDVLIRASLYIGITSQSLFAIDTDIPSYSDQGHSFVLQHFSGLNPMMNQLRAELDKYVPEVKRKFVRSGTASVETRMGYMWYNLIASSPTGSLFRNYYFNG